MKTFEDFIYGFADAQRIDSIIEFLKEVENDPEYNIEPPEDDWLLDPYDGYEFQTYIRNLGDSFIYYEGWSKLCWSALYKKKEYRGLSKIKALDKFLKIRVPIIAEESNCDIIDSGYNWVETWDNDIDSGYIMWIKMRKK